MSVVRLETFKYMFFIFEEIPILLNIVIHTVQLLFQAKSAKIG